MTEGVIKKSSVKGIIAKWRARHGFDHECYRKTFDELYKRITQDGQPTTHTNTK
jgi:hypothetical protein